MDALRANDAVLFSQIARNAKGYKPLIESAMDLALEGRTSSRKSCCWVKVN